MKFGTLTDNVLSLTWHIVSLNWHSMSFIWRASSQFGLVVFCVCIGIFLLKLVVSQVDV